MGMYALAAALLISEAAAAPLTLEEAFRAALTKTETLPIAASQVRESDARYDEAKGNFFPNLSANATRQQQERAQSATGSRDQTTARITLTHSIFAGGRDRANLSSARAERTASEFNARDTRNDIYVDVARAYFGLLSAYREVANIEKSIELTRKRVEELRRRRKIGQSRNIEVLAAEAQQAVLEAQLLAAHGERRVAKSNFANATGLDRDTELADNRDLPKEVGRVYDYLARIEERPDLLALKATEESAASAVRAAFAGHLPGLDLTGNYYLSRSPRAPNAPDWDATLSLSLPLFAGGSVNAQVRQAEEQRTQATLFLDQRRRDAETEIRTAHNRLVSALEQVKALERALSATEQNYREQEKDYRFGMATNLDVLQALTSYQDTKRTLDRTRYEALSAFEELKAATNQVGM